MNISEMEELDIGMTNFDHSIDDGLAEALRARPDAKACYTGWNFCAYVWFADEKFHARVWRYGSVVDEDIPADTLREIMDEVSDRYGYG